MFNYLPSDDYLDAINAATWLPKKVLDSSEFSWQNRGSGIEEIPNPFNPSEKTPMQLPQIIALGGRQGSGKTTLVRALVARGYMHINLLSPVYKMFNIAHPGHHPWDDQDYKDTIVPGTRRTVREELIAICDLHRKQNPNFLVEHAKREFTNRLDKERPVVISAIRLRPELEWADSLSAHTCYLMRGEEPKRVPRAQKATEETLRISDFHGSIQNDFSYPESLFWTFAEQGNFRVQFPMASI